MKVFSSWEPAPENEESLAKTLAEKSRILESLESLLEQNKNQSENMKNDHTNRLRDFKEKNMAFHKAFHE